MAIFPGAIATDTDLYLVSNNLGTVLTAGIDAVVTTIPVVSTTGFPTTGWITIEQEAIQYTGITGTSFTGCTRGAGGTVSAAHLIGVAVKQTVVAAHHNSLKDETIAIETFIDLHIGKSTTVTAAEFQYLFGVTSSIQTQLNAKAADSLVVHLAGTETITGQKTFNDLRGTFGANLAANGFKLTGLAAGTTNGDSLRYEQLINQYLLLTGGTLSGALAMGNNKITGLAAATANGDALRYEQLIGLYLLLTGGTMSGTIAMGSNKITGLAAATANGDAVRYEQLPGIAGTITNWVSYTPTLGGFNTPTVSVWWRRIGDTLIVQGWGNAATFAATNISITLPNSVTIDTAKIGNTTNRQLVGVGYLAQDSVIGVMDFFFDGSDTAKIYGGNGSEASQQFAKRTASSLFGASTPTTMAFRFEIPISSWTI